jgi:hypothetical protein
VEFLLSEQVGKWLAAVLGVIAACAIAAALMVIVSEVANRAEPKPPPDDQPE